MKDNKKEQSNIGTIVHPCKCSSTFQDEKYGRNNRVMNNAPSKGSQKNRYRCTVCGNEVSVR